MDKVVSIYYENLFTNEVFVENEDYIHRSASLIKIPIMLLNNTLDLNKKVKIKEENKVDYSVVTEVDKEYTVRELINWMMLISDNTATNELIDIIGFKNINSFIKEHSKTTVLNRKMMDFKSKDNYTTAKDIASFLKLVYKDPFSFNLMKRNRSNNKLLRYIDEEVVLLKKSGLLDNVSHEAGIFIKENNDYILCVLTKGYKEEEANKKIATISRRFYEKIYL